MAKRLFSGIQPSGNLHLGNYLGAIKQWVEMQDDNEAIFCIVDLHAITVAQDPAELRRKTLEIAKIYLAAGIDPAKSTLFIQSHVSAHAELGWILNTIARMAELERMTQFKEKSSDVAKRIQQRTLAAKVLQEEVIEEDPGRRLARLQLERESLQRYASVGVGLFDYPVLMAADILLYDTNVVPVGDDQMQHVELTRTLAERFNKRFGETFVIPEGKITKEGARIMGLDDPLKKMSKSAGSVYNYIALTDDAQTVRKKIKKAVTDSGSEIVYHDEKPALKNLINIYTLLSGKTSQEIEKMYVGKGYGDFKTDLAEVIVGFLTPFQERLAAISDDTVLAVLKTGADKARALAAAKMEQVREHVGFLE
ncbi:MAG: tryptophan--tRNA ligase [Candidatus Moranbacteria bacterium]|nr:tryptophan--tRNA ligase [Candidatus Moranbacteria bacterium]